MDGQLTGLRRVLARKDRGRRPDQACWSHYLNMRRLAQKQRPDDHTQRIVEALWLELSQAGCSCWARLVAK